MLVDDAGRVGLREFRAQLRGMIGTTIVDGDEFMLDALGHAYSLLQRFHEKPHRGPLSVPGRGCNPAFVNPTEYRSFAL